jgi:hypothetical protein
VVTVVVFVEVALVGEMLWLVLTPLSSEWLGTGFTLLVLTPVLSRLFAHVLVFEFQVGDLNNIWLIDSSCSRHMTGDRGWFSSLIPVVTKRYITFGDHGRGRVLSEGEIKVSDKITLRRVALVQSLGYNLLSVSQLLDEGFEVLFRPGGSRILDSRGDLVCMVVPEGQVFRADFSQSSGVEQYFLAGSSSELWKGHRKLGHLSFDLLSRLSKLNLVRGLPRLRLEKELVCAPCRHAKMVASSHPPLTDVLTERPCELLHMDLDEDITPMDTNNTPLVDVQGPITRSRARQLNLQVSSFLCMYSCAFENRVLPNDLIVLRNEGEDQHGHEEGLGGVEDQQGRPDQGGGLNQFDFVSVSDSKNSPS